ncbi:MAG: helix-turn-helix domain-containing protein [Parcubacteria group bacterium]|nr:helix-turn-helix domain-containing protein [Parcubacteria group bacterium]
MTKKYYSTTEVAHILHISRVGVFNRIKKGKLKAEKVGRNYIVSHENLLEALGKSIGQEKKDNIEKALNKAIADYGEVFKLLGKE